MALGAQKGWLNWFIPWMNVQFLLRTNVNYQTWFNFKATTGWKVDTLSYFGSVFISVFMLPVCVFMWWQLGWFIPGITWLVVAWDAGIEGREVTMGLSWGVGCEKIMSNFWDENWDISVRSSWCILSNFPFFEFSYFSIMLVLFDKLSPLSMNSSWRSHSLISDLVFPTYSFCNKIW